MRVHLALNVRDLEKAVEYYAKIFDTKVNKRQPGYANFVIDEPPLKLSLFELPDAPERLNHVGVEVFEPEKVDAAIERLSALGLLARSDQDTTCCYARKSEVWTTDPDGLRWEWYKVLADSDSFGEAPA